MDWNAIAWGVGSGFLWMFGAMIAMGIMAVLMMRTHRGRHGKMAAACAGMMRGFGGAEAEGQAPSSCGCAPPHAATSSGAPVGSPAGSH